ncbi:MAG: polysaccharide deacetylase family protein [Planctomycetes bacterium]|nr:polysaccharide deacetylase family protein [Planctomycetota bacterium]
MYHNIPEDKQSLFEHHIQYLASMYQFLTPLQFQEFVQGKYRISGINLLITFDDGFKSNRIVAEKFLNPFGIKGVFFVPTEFIGLQDANKCNEFIVKQIYKGIATDPEISSDMEPLAWKDLEYLLEQGHAIGFHTKSHKRLSELHSKEELYDEIVESGNMLERKLGVPINYFAYPFGDIDSVSKLAMNIVKSRYKYCFSGVRGPNYFPVDTYAILRDTISLDDPLSYVRFIIEGGLDIIYRKKVKKLLALARD